MMVPTDLQVRLERFHALWLPLLACTVSTGVEGCQRKCTGSKVPCRFQNPRVMQEIRARVNPRAEVERQVTAQPPAGRRVGPESSWSARAPAAAPPADRP